MDTFGDSPFIGLFLHEVDPGDDYDYLMWGNRSPGYGSNYREVAVYRGLADIRDRPRDITVPQGRWTLRVVGDATRSMIRVRTSGPGSAVVEPIPAADDPWTTLEPSYGNTTFAGLGSNLTTTGPSFVYMSFGYRPSPYVTDVEWGRCTYHDHVEMEQTAWAPGCPGRVTGQTSATEYQGPLLFGGPGGSSIGLFHDDGARRWAWGFWHLTAGVGGSQSGFVYQLDLT